MLTIRKAESSDDYEILKNLLCNYVEEMRGIECNIKELSRTDVENVYLINQELEYYLAFDVDIALGFVSFDKTEDLVYLSDLYIRPTCRRHQIGTNLVDFVLKNASKFYIYNLKKNKIGEMFFNSVFSVYKDVTSDYISSVKYVPYDYNKVSVFTV